MQDTGMIILHITEKSIRDLGSAIVGAYTLTPDNGRDFKKSDLPHQELLKINSIFKIKHDFSKNVEEQPTVSELVIHAIQIHIMSRNNLSLISTEKTEIETDGDSKIIRHISYFKKKT